MGVSGCRRVLIVFYSYPPEASLTAIVRGLEECGADCLLIISSERHEGTVKDLASKVSRCVRGVKVTYSASIPSIGRLSDLTRVIKVIKSLIPRGVELCFISSAGSRLEVSSLSMVIDRGRTDVIYVSFLWGPWVGAYYPYTPKPLEAIHVIHPSRGSFCGGGVDVGVDISCLDAQGFLNTTGLGSLRALTLRNQLFLNRELCPSRCCYEEGLVNCSCRGLVIEFDCAGVRFSTEVRDYCDYDDVVNAVSDLWLGFRDACLGTDYFLTPRSRVGTACWAAHLVLAASSVALLTASGGLGVSVPSGTALCDTVPALGRRVVIDTNVAYYGIHTQLYESSEVRRLITIPQCLLAEMYAHQVEVKDPYRAVRGAIAELITSELTNLGLSIEYVASTTPCEVGVGMSLANRRDVIFATADKRAYEAVNKIFKIDTVLTELKPINQVRFTHDQQTRRVAYAYYAITQLKTIAKQIQNQLTQTKTTINIKTK